MLLSLTYGLRGVNLQNIGFVCQKQISFLELGTKEEIQKMTPLTKEFEQNHQEIKVRVNYASDGKLYFLAPTTGTDVVFYDRDLFDAAGILYPEDGWTWEEFREISKKPTIDKNGDGKIGQYALNGLYVCDWAPMVLQRG
jgi:ABC-type glycerol-3-phosphate transport system substrate-binding protein